MRLMVNKEIILDYFRSGGRIRTSSDFTLPDLNQDEYPVELNITECDDIEEEIICVKEILEEIRDYGISHGVLKYLSGELADEKDSEILFNYLGQFDKEVKTALIELASESTGLSEISDTSSRYKLEFNAIVSGGKFSMKLKSQYCGQKTINEISALYDENFFRDY